MTKKKTTGPAANETNEPRDETIEVTPEDIETPGELEDRAETGEAPESERDIPASELEEVIAEAAEYKDRWMRAVAELDNYRRRTAREYEQQQMRAGERILRSFLDPVDNLARGIASARETARKLDERGDGKAVDELNAFIQGMEMAYKQLMDALEREQVKVMEPVGEPFDPNCHEALMMTEAPDAPPNTVVEVVSRGYWLGERVLRHATVVVSKPAAEVQPGEEEPE